MLPITWTNTRTNERNNTVQSTFRSTERYEWDQPEFFKQGWEQYDTSQDAWYFGVWVNKQTKQILTYAEGDIILISCPTIESYNEEIKHMNNFYEEGYICKTIENNGTTTYIQDRNIFFIVKEKP